MTEAGRTPVALVTGASGALGAAVARVLDGRGYALALHYRANEQAVTAVRDELGSPAVAVAADLSSWPEVAGMEATIRGELGGIDVVVNCAAVRRDGLLALQKADTWRDVIDVNLVGAFHVARAVVPGMISRRYGRVINVVSPSATRGSAGQTAYAASKAGVVALTQSLALELARSGITVNALSPGFMDTRMTENLSPARREAIVAAIPAGRVTTPDEVSRAVTFVIESPYMTGQVVAVDGGVSL